MLNLPCSCQCHRFCHLCGREFVGPNDYHTNCQDTTHVASSLVNYKGPDRYAPWPVADPPPETFTDFEREGYGDHEPTA